jgi:hypothetical protein
LISKFLVGRKTSEVVENADESSFGEGQGKKEVILPGGIAIPTPELSLEELLRDYGLLRFKVIDQETTVSEPYADITTWYKVEIVETLHRQRKASDEAQPFELPGRLHPLLPTESLMVVSGGVINVDGITVVREVSTFDVVYIPREEYLIVGYLEYGGKLIRPSSGRASVFHVINKRLKSGQSDIHSSSAASSIRSSMSVTGLRARWRIITRSASSRASTAASDSMCVVTEI